MINKRSRFAKISSTILAITLGIALVPFLNSLGEVRADDSGKIIMGIPEMARPVPPGDEASDPWSGSYVYFGTYDGQPIKFRVLDPDSNAYGSNTILLDCDSILFNDYFDTCGAKCYGIYPFGYDYEAAMASGEYEPCRKTETLEWADCTLNKYLNGDDFLYNEDIFSKAEQEAIAQSFQESHKIRKPTKYNEDLTQVANFQYTYPLSGEKIFLLDVDDMLNPDYGYASVVGSQENNYWNILSRQKLLFGNDTKLEKGSCAKRYWLRTLADIDPSTLDIPNCVNPYRIGAVHEYGWMYANEISHTFVFGVSPALNIDKSKILYTTCVSGNIGEVGAVYKFTFVNDSHKFSAKANAEGKNITVDYYFSGTSENNNTGVSILITDKEYNDKDATFLYRNDLVPSSDNSYSGTFVLPDNLAGNWGEDYHVYAIAEYDGNSSDTVSTPYELKKPDNFVIEENQSESTSEVNTETETPTTPSTINPAPATTSTEEPESEEKGFDAFVERLYEVALGRASESEGKAFWCEHVKNGDLTGADCAREFLISKEFKDRNLSDEDFLKVLYSTFFNRKAEDDVDGFNFWLNSLKSEGRDNVVEGFINSTEWCNVCASYGVRSGATTAKATIASKNTIEFVERLYTTCLGRDADKEGLDYWSLGLTNQELTGTQAVREFVYSKEFQDQDFSDEEFLNRLYKTFMGREADSDGMTYWGNLLSSGTSRNEVFDSFARSTEFAEICNSYAIHR